MKPPQLIFFDLGDVVCRFVPHERSKALADITGISEKELDAVLWTTGFLRASDAGEYTLEQMCRFICEATRTELKETEIIDCWRRAFLLDTAVLETAIALSAHTPVGMLTNNPPLLREALPVFFPEVESLFEPIVFSCELKASKPDPRSFKEAEAKTAYAGSELMLIDDSPGNCDAAAALGWQTIRFVDSDDLRSKLAISGLL